MKQYTNMQNKGQSLSVEMLLTISIFIAFFIIVLSFLLYSPGDLLTETATESQRLSNLLSDPTRPDTKLITDRNTVDTDKLVEIAALSEQELQELFGISDPFCIFLFDENSKVVYIELGDGNLTSGIGSGDIYFNEIRCGERFNLSSP